MWRFVLLFTATFEAEVRDGDLRLRKRNQLYGSLSLYWCCLFGHRNAVHANLTDRMVKEAQASGSDAAGYAIQVSDYTYLVLITRRACRSAIFSKKWWKLHIFTYLS